jgi:hypothetical protein
MKVHLAPLLLGGGLGVVWLGAMAWLIHCRGRRRFVEYRPPPDRPLPPGA